VKITTVGYEYDLGKQVTQIDNFIAAGVDLILLNPGDPKAIGPAIKKAQAAGIIVVAVDTAAEGADATVTTNNVQAGEISCQYIVDKLGGKGDVIIENGPQVSAVIDRVVGCKNVLSKNPGLKVLSSDQDAKGSREGGLTVTQGYLTRFAKIDAIFAINDPQAIGTDLAARQQQRSGIIITAVDGAPDIEAALKDPGAQQIQASASQDPFFMARRAVQIVFQHPDSSLNPRQTVADILARPLRLYGGDVSTIPALLEEVRLPAAYARRYPHQLSGGEKQRVAIARAFAAKPDLIICDEITAPLDVSVQASVVELLLRLRAANGTAYMFITHDLNLVQQVAHRIAVMRNGEIVDLLGIEDLRSGNVHPYTRELIAASPAPVG